MADSITSSQVLGIGIEYTDSSETRTTTINIPNFRNDITEQQIKSAFTNNNVLIYGYDENRNALPVTSDNILTASTTNETIHNLDIGWED